MSRDNQPTNYTDLVRQSAPLAQLWSKRYCCAGVYGADSCCWYHRAWQYFSLLGVVSTPWRERDFYIDALGGIPLGEGLDHVLISGASDYSMLAVVDESAHRIGRSAPGVLAVDKCRTPLALSCWYAGRQGLRCDTRCVDILSADLSNDFDVVCTHSFLGNFSPDERVVLMRRWHALLRPGGRVITINRVRPGSRGLNRFDAEQAGAFRERVVSRARTLPQPLDVDVRTLGRWAREYTRNYASQPVSGVDQLRDLFELNGFVLDQFDVDTSAPDGPSSAAAGIRVRLVARRIS